MPGSTWSVQDAKNRFSAMLAAARRQPQTVTRHGKPTAVVVSAEEYARLRHLEQLEAVPFSEHLLSIPTDEGAFERLEGGLRETEL
jgi:prevent-host-death family protein